MSVLVVGSVALDYLETPFGIREKAFGGSATFISLAASYTCPEVRFVGIVGDDFPQEHVETLQSHGIRLDGLERAPGTTFSWGGRYHEDMNHRDTLYTELGVFEHFDPKIPAHWTTSEFVMLGNIHPSLQLRVLDQITKPTLVVCDTMNLWITISLEELKQTIARVDVLILNDQEAAMLTGTANVHAAGRMLRTMGPRIVVIKKGEHGAVLYTDEGLFQVPAYPLEGILDPTGAGDTFAGGFIGWLARTGDIGSENLRRALVHGTTLASFCVEQFGIDGIRSLTEDEIAARSRTLLDMTRFTL